MKLATFIPENGRAARLGALLSDGSTLADLAGAAKAAEGRAPAYLSDAIRLMEAGERGMDHARLCLAFAERERPPDVVRGVSSARLLAPVPRPRTLRDCLAFEEHLIRATQTVLSWRSPALATVNQWVRRATGQPLVRPPRVWYEMPIYYMGNPDTVVGPDADILWPAYTKLLDYELEFGIFIGREGRDIPRERAMEHVFGYTVFNDFSARDIQLREMAGRLGPAKGKSFDTGNAMGPYLVTADEVPDPYGLAMEARVNGEVWSSGTTADMHHRFDAIIAHVSMSETIHPGDFIGSGTVGGGCGLELDRWLSPGDVVELSVGGLGVLRNRVVR